ncbi:hypothetical protein ACRRTK_010573 [Alexandromys fortis]
MITQQQKRGMSFSDPLQLLSHGVLGLQQTRQRMQLGRGSLLSHQPGPQLCLPLFFCFFIFFLSLG